MEPEFASVPDRAVCTVVECFVCRTLGSSQQGVRLSKMRSHIGSHVLNGEVEAGACGFCGRVGTCSTRLARGTGKDIRIPVSDCVYYSKFSIKAALNDSTKTVRCTNAPMLCTACPKATYVWKYGMKLHWQVEHPTRMNEFAANASYRVLAEERLSAKRRASRQEGGNNDGGIGGRRGSTVTSRTALHAPSESGPTSCSKDPLPGSSTAASDAQTNSSGPIPVACTVQAPQLLSPASPATGCGPSRAPSAVPGADLSAMRSCSAGQGALFQPNRSGRIAASCEMVALLALERTQFHRSFSARCPPRPQAQQPPYRASSPEDAARDRHMPTLDLSLEQAAPECAQSFAAPVVAPGAASQRAHEPASRRTTDQAQRGQLGAFSRACRTSSDGGSSSSTSGLPALSWGPSLRPVAVATAADSMQLDEQLSCWAPSPRSLIAAAYAIDGGTLCAAPTPGAERAEAGLQQQQQQHTGCLQGPPASTARPPLPFNQGLATTQPAAVSYEHAGGYPLTAQPAAASSMPYGEAAWGGGSWYGNCASSCAGGMGPLAAAQAWPSFQRMSSTDEAGGPALAAQQQQQAAFARDHCNGLFRSDTAAAFPWP